MWHVIVHVIIDLGDLLIAIAQKAFPDGPYIQEL